MTIKVFDIDSETIILQGMLHGVCFDEIYFNAELEYFYGKADKEECSVVIVEVINLIRELRDTLHEIPTTEVVKKNYKDWLEQNAPDEAYKRIAYLDKVISKLVPSEVAVKYAIRRLQECYDNRMASSTLEECVDIFESEGGAPTMTHMRESIAKRARLFRKNFKIVDYKDDYKIRERRQHDAQLGISNVKRIPYGIRGLDIATGGAGRGEVTYIVASSGRGKSITLIDITVNMICNHNQRVAFFTKEMSTIETGFRYDARFSGIRHPKFFENSLQENDYSVWDDTIDGLPNNSLKIVEMIKNFSISEVEKALDSLSWSFKPDVVFLDYIGLMEGSEKGSWGGAWHSYDTVCREIKDFAKERNLIVITASQLKTQSSEKLEITYDDIFIGKNVLVQNADVVAALLSDEWMRELGRAILQVMKVRGKTPQQTKFDLFPDYDRIRIDTGVETSFIEKPQEFNKSGVNLIKNE